MGKKHWKTIYKELQKPTMLYSDDGKSMCIIGTYSKEKAFQLIKQELKEWFGGRKPEYKNFTSPAQLKIAMLRRPIESENDDMDANFIAEDIKAETPRPTDVWIHHTLVKLKKIPHFDTIEEEADFWDTHDTTEYIDWTKAVKVKFPNLRLTNPKRIQRKRTKGWKMPGGTVYVGRPSKWGNQYIVGELISEYDSKKEVFTHETAVDYFEFYIRDNYKFINEIKEELAGRNLCCWCPLDKPCHADILLKIANEEKPLERHVIKLSKTQSYCFRCHKKNPKNCPHKPTLVTKV